MRYKSGYKYVLAADHTAKLPFHAGVKGGNDFIYLSGKQLVVRKGYAWDGASGIAIDSPAFMRGSLIHDALYQLFREGVINILFRDDADRLLQSDCMEDGMWRIRAWWVYRAVKRFGKSSATGSGRKVYTAP